MHIIGVPKETKRAEKRVALIPVACKKLTEVGFTVLIESGAGAEAGYEDALYQEAGATLVPDAASLYQQARLIVKVKEPQPSDLPFLREDHILFCYLHLAAEPALTEALQKIGLEAYAFETMVKDGATPLLAPMSAIAGRLATQIGTWYLHAPRGGRGILMGGIEGHKSGHVTVIGAGVAGQEAAYLAYQMGADVALLDINPARLAAFKVRCPHVQTHLSSPEAVRALLPKTDLLVGAVYVLGRKAPIVVSEEEIKTMPKGSVVVDISIDQGGCIATARPCTHDAPVYDVHGVLHSAITNMPAAAPRTASEALSAAITPYVMELAAGKPSETLEGAINVRAGALLIDLAQAS